MTWPDLLSRWALVAADLAERYGLDEEDPMMWERRSWPWLRRRILGLVTVPDTRVRLALDAREAPPVS